MREGGGNVEGKREGNWGKMGREEVKWNDRNENEIRSSLHASAVRLWLLFLVLLETCFFSLFFLFLAICEVDD